MHTEKKSEHAVAQQCSGALPFYREHVVAVGAVATDNGRDFCGTENQPYGLYPALNDIEHRKTKVKSPKRPKVLLSGSARRCWTNSPALHSVKNSIKNVEAFQEDLGITTQRRTPAQGCRGCGKHPLDTIPDHARVVRDAVWLYAGKRLSGSVFACKNHSVSDAKTVSKTEWQCGRGDRT